MNIYDIENSFWPKVYGPSIIDVWNYGKESWCNLEGRYIHIVADLSGYTAIPNAADMGICNLGIMGTKYARLEPLLS